MIETGFFNQKEFFGLGKETRSVDFANQNAWVLRNCTPTKWSIGALDGNSNSLILESLELVAEEISVGK